MILIYARRVLLGEACVRRAPTYGEGLNSSVHSRRFERALVLAQGYVRC